MAAEITVTSRENDLLFLNIKIYLSNNNVIHDYCKVVQSAVYSECEYN